MSFSDEGALTRGRSWWAVAGPPALALLAVVGLAQFTAMDEWAQSFFWRPGSGWVVDGNAYGPRLLFYLAPKGMLILFGAGALLLGAAAWRGWAPERWKVPALYMALCMAVIPAAVSGLKASTNVHCPSELVEYGGEHPHVRLLEAPPPGMKRGRCFPAGHASGGFALAGLIHLGRTRRRRWLGAGITLGVGGVMGVYQMAKGAHFLSHTLATLALALLLAGILAKLWDHVARGMGRNGETARGGVAPGAGRAVSGEKTL
ncbi:MAG: phosphatase PAP2 family protein [Magnetococcales bacterium]|nr:phosphatase PAP2 family protein [Magnetococcales bacterium]